MKQHLQEYKIIVDYKDVTEEVLGECSYCKVQGINESNAELISYTLDKNLVIKSSHPICRAHFNRLYARSGYLIGIAGERFYIAATVGIPPRLFKNISLPEGKYASLIDGYNIILRSTKNELIYFCVDCLLGLRVYDELIEHIEKHKNGETNNPARSSKQTSETTCT